MAKFGTKAERATNLWTYAQRRPAPYEQTTETKIAKHSIDLKKQKRGEIKIRHRQRDTTSVASFENSNATRALTVRKPRKPQPKRRQTTAPPNDPSESASQDQPGTSSEPAPPVPPPQEQPELSLVSDTSSQNKGRKQKRPQFCGFTEADISPTSSLTSSNPSKSKKCKTKKQSKKSSATKKLVVALIQSAEQSRVPSPPSPDIQIDQVSPPDSRIRYIEYEQERELSVWDAENEI